MNDTDGYCSLEPTSGEPVFIRGFIPRRERPVYLDNCGETFLGDDWKQHSYCEICWQEYCAKRDAGCATAARGGTGEIYGIYAEGN
jgi:hypothetical protein